MTNNLTRVLRRAAGGSVLFVLGVGAVGSQPPAMMATAAGTTAVTQSAGVRAVWEASDRTLVHEERVAALAIRAAIKPPAVVVVAAAVPVSHPVARAPRTVALAAAATAPPAPVAAAGPVSAPAGNSAGYSFGYCTWWVSHKRLIPWHGMAYQWWSIARSYGFAEGSTPRAGAVMVMGAGMAGASAGAGHVAYVESVNANGSFVISEMNWYGSGGGWGKVNYRTVTSMNGILGFIY
ncbi:MAG: CHAP domain-containing protein [Candidatus Dormibacteraeota bacterium]|nr:CHAP domain-containing protein [Candidatus Dormibacteraeota bacterium]